MNFRNSHKDFVVISISFEKANAEIRGKFSFFPDQVGDLCKIVQTQKLGKVFVLSTCNRTEIYCYSKNYFAIINAYCSVINASFEEFTLYCQVQQGQNAINHLFRVSSGLESQILGDFEIISQIKIWYKRFQKLGTTNYYLERVVNTAIQVSKRIKTQTSISNGVASVSYAAVHYILNQVNDSKSKKILIIGTGKIGQNTCENLIKHVSEENVYLMNRSEEKLEKIATKFNLKQLSYTNLEKEINLADIIIVATSAHEPIILKSMINSNKEHHFIDLSIPENIDKNIQDLKNISLVNVDSLSRVINETFESRKSEIPKALEIIKEYTKEFNLWLEQRKFVPIIKSLKENLNSIQKNELKSILKVELDEKSDEIIMTQKISQRITNRFAEFLNNNPDKADSAIEIFTEIFQLEHS